MKERFLLAVSWWAFLHFAVYVLAVAADILGGLELGGVWEDLLRGYYLGLWQTIEIAIGFPFAVWVVLWIGTGSPRILPWRK